VHQEEQRHASFLAKATVSETDSPSFCELRRRGLVIVTAHETSIDEGLVGNHATSPYSPLPV
jgi:hypothetical protein